MSERVSTPASLCDKDDNGYDRHTNGHWWRIKNGTWFRQLDPDYSHCDARIIALLEIASTRAVRCEGERDEARREFIEAHLMIREIKGIMAPCICRRCREYSAALPR